MSTEHDGPLYTVTDIKSHLNISRTKVYDLIRTRQLHSITIGRSRRITPRALNDYLTTRTLEGY